MRNYKLILLSFGSAAATFLYTAAVGWIISHGQQMFGNVKNFWGPAAFLLLFVVSATVVGLFVLGRPAYLYFNGSRGQAIRLLLATLGWLILMTVAVFLIQPWR